MKITKEKIKYLFNRISNTAINIGTVIVYIAFAIVVVVISIKSNTPTSIDADKTLGKIICDAILNTVSISIAILDFIVVLAIIFKKKYASKIKTIIVGFLIYISISFDYVAIQYPLPQFIIVIVNFVLFITPICFMICNGNNANVISQTKHHRPLIHKIIKNTKNNKIVAVQMYFVHSYNREVEGVEKVSFKVHSCENFVRDGYDMNSIFSMTYEIEKGFIEGFNVVLHLYDLLIEGGDEAIKSKLIDAIEKERDVILQKLRAIQSPDDVTKEDCCLARLLVIYLSFLHILEPDLSATETPPDYVGEVSLCDGDLALSQDIEEKLFTLIRTGIFGAILLGENWRHVFHYKKHGSKQGRKYCASRIYSREISNEQMIDICLFTIEEHKYEFVANYILKSISSMERRIYEALHKIYNGGDNDE